VVGEDSDLYLIPIEAMKELVGSERMKRGIAISVAVLLGLAAAA
jgi:hypothetical protein